MMGCVEGHPELGGQSIIEQKLQLHHSISERSVKETKTALSHYDRDRH